jgi:DNA-binding IclR family transcriptional regulator
MTAKTEDRYLVPALERGLHLLSQFTRTTPVLTGADLARNLNLPRVSVFRILHTLERSGFVERLEDSASYKLGIGVLRLGFEFLASMELNEYGRPVIEQLRNNSGYSAHLVVRDGRDVVFVDKATGRSALFQSIQVGARLPAHATVLGRLLLSDLDMPALKKLYPEKQLASYTDKTPKNLDQLKILIDEDRRNGYGISQGGFETGISTLAAPVYNELREVVAAISITVPAQRVDPEQAKILITLVKSAASQLTDRLKHFQRPSKT